MFKCSQHWLAIVAAIILGGQGKETKALMIVSVEHMGGEEEGFSPRFSK